MNFVVGAREDLDASLLMLLERYRYKVFVEKLGWQLCCEHGLERDQFDRPDTVYVIALRDGEVIGAARLLPTTRPYLLGDVFPELLEDRELPGEPGVWELSRFCAVDFRSTNDSPLVQFSSGVAVALLGCALRSASELGARSVVTVSPVGVERLLARNGFKGIRAGRPTVAGGQLIAAYFIDCSKGSSQATRNPAAFMTESAAA